MTEPNETTPLNDMRDDQKFRTIKTRSPVRGVLFAVESVAVLAGYIYLLYRRDIVDSRMYLLAAYGAIYMLRLNLMAQWLLPREIAVEELTFVMLLWVPVILLSFALLAASEEMSLITALLSIILYATGSFLNTYSELQRKYWKQRPENKGRCYTAGLFSLSRNINYLGDVLIFAGWAVATASWWNVWVPVAMALSFYYYHIPSKESYLAQRYREDWPSYVATTKSFIPYVC